MATPHRRAGALLAATLALAGVLLVPSPAQAGDIYVQLSPSTVEAGYLVGIRASCSENTVPATVESAAFGTVTAQPQDGLLTAAALVPEGTDAGTFRVKLNCPDGRNASTMLNVVAADRPKRGPATGFGGSAGPDAGDLLLVGGITVTLLGAVLGLVALRRRGATVPARGRHAP
ncbi:hypothetical protein [Micromonospora sp. NBC_01796]|uniref:hypothetical protein n=1 Tax=Micromonospora sp. NBC_01796 TaxID=2975987 RepID=UPI002DD83C0F|nr:hypothetical protein [Micromonospora sp. NBC_01796]WSA86323.1 hypothetical protein OIE47_01510 [Micromonospora sp. NBC_01796]